MTSKFKVRYERIELIVPVEEDEGHDWADGFAWRTLMGTPWPVFVNKWEAVPVREASEKLKEEAPELISHLEFDTILDED
jgi:hypothetical protein